MEAALSSVAQVKALVPDFIFKRAKELASSNKLHSISFQGPLLHNSVAACTGSNPGDSYNLSILVDAKSPSKPMCQCSCPAQAKGNLCKHVVALLLLRTKELAKGAKEQSNAAILSEFKLAEDRLAGDREKEPALSDSQATEVFVPSDDKPELADEEINATAQSVSPVVKNNQKRVLPSWFSEGFSAPKKEAKEKKITKKTASKQDAADEEERKTGMALQSHRITQTRGKGKSRLVDKGGPKRPYLRKRKDIEEEADDFITDSDGKDSSSEREQKVSSRAGRGIRQRNTDATVKKGGCLAPKRSRTRGYVESDLSEEEEPEVLDNDCTFESKEYLDLTTEDLVNLANEHLQMEKRNNEAGHHHAGSSGVNDKPQNDAVSPKKNGSIFSVQGWNEIAAKNLDAKDALFSQETSEMPVLPSTFVGELQRNSSHASIDHGGLNSLSTIGINNAKGADSLEPAENIVDDMLGLFFGPTLSKTVNSKVEGRQDFGEGVSTSSMAPLAETVMPDAVLPVSVDAVPKPKKKGSLKDTVMMYLG